MTARSRIADKIKALRAKTRAAGCTEAEALAAAALAARLMREHGLDEASLEMTEADAWERNVKATWRSKVANIIAHCTSTAAIRLVERDGAHVVFVGREPGPEIALYLRDVCFRAIEREVRLFKQGAIYRRRRTLATKRAAVADFIDGVIMRVGLRLVELFEPMRDPQALQLARTELARRYPDASTSRLPARTRRVDTAKVAGWAAGGHVDINRGVAGSAAPLAIGRSE
jgi:hypothetical protein